jgi:predicted GIY-YIG superfamily endonuclease
MAVNQGPFVLVYTSPVLPDQSTARKNEIKIKRWTRPNKQKLIEGTLKWKSLENSSRP